MRGCERPAPAMGKRGEVGWLIKVGELEEGPEHQAAPQQRVRQVKRQ